MDKKNINKNLKVDQGKRKVKRVDEKWSKDTENNPDDLEIFNDEDV